MPVRFSDKPVGISSHRVTPTHLGFMEHLEARLRQKLWPCHRLDRDTSGAFCFSDEADSASLVSKAFENGWVKKTYQLVTDRPVNFENAVVRSWIEKKDGAVRSENPIFSKESGDPTSFNSETHFEKLKTVSGFTLVNARPITGKTHQIRLHAKDLGLPLLGDSEHDGTPYPVLMLHSTQIEFTEGEFKGLIYTSTPLTYFENLRELTDPEFVSWLASAHRAKRLYPETESVRLIHLPNVRCDQIGPVLWFSWFRESAPTDNDLIRMNRLAKALDTNQWFCRLMVDRGRDPHQVKTWASPDLPERWLGTETGSPGGPSVQYEFRRDTGTSSGLFLDQRANRNWVLENSRGVRVCNLFCYTGGFSVAAAVGGAREVASVDVGQPVLLWAQKNFELNGVSHSDFEFFRSDALIFLAVCKRRGRVFDLVICDPPSFGRSENGVFQVEKDLAELLTRIDSVLAPNGKLLFCTNFEGWDQLGFYQKVRQTLKNYKQLAAVEPGWDFELPGQPRILKTALFQKAP